VEGESRPPPSDLWEVPGQSPESRVVPATESFVYPSLQHRRIWLPIFVSIVVVIGVAVGAVVISGGPSTPGAGVAPADFVVSATQTTLTQRTADLVFGGSISAQGQSIPITGNGQANLSYPQQFAATVAFSGSGRSFQEKEVVAHNHFYMGISSGGQDVSALVPGKHWVEIPIPVGAGSSPGTGTSDPLAQLQMLVKKGNTVTGLGTKAIHGVTCSGYAVTISRQNVVTAELKALSSSGLDPVTMQRLAQAAQSIPTPTIDVWFNSSKLLRRIGFLSNQTQNGGKIAIDVEMDFVNYGAPVSISVPSPADVASYSQFQAAANASSGGGS
jgi:hypothetical protein